jgi:hypothetical protein
MIMSKDPVITEIRYLKVGAKGVLNYHKALVHGLYTTSKLPSMLFSCGMWCGKFVDNQWPFQRMKCSPPQALQILKAHQRFMPCNASFGYARKYN